MSPHLQVYKPQLTSVLSILHRGTGLVLSAASLLLAWWLIALAGGDQAYAGAMEWLGSGLARLVLVGVSFCFFYHLCNGIRHLVWDAGYGFEIRQTYASGWAVVAISILLTAGFWSLILADGGS
ncbi:MAG: succinate dehydrogenase, cytochrome b556 subunit [Gammaproteobacteria bacterium]